MVTILYSLLYFLKLEKRRKIKKKAERETSGHILVGTFLKLPMFCEYCSEFMIGTHAYRCKACDVLLHKWDSLKNIKDYWTWL